MFISAQMQPDQRHYVSKSAFDEDDRSSSYTEGAVAAFEFVLLELVVATGRLAQTVVP
jgi:hypothetical protein